MNEGNFKLEELISELKSAQDLNAGVARVLSPERARHSLGAAELAAELAVRYGYTDPPSVSWGGLLHDIGKALAPSAFATIQDWGPWVPDEAEIQSGTPLLHAPAGALVAGALGLPEEVAAGIRYHVTGRSGLTLADKIIMAADAAEKTRVFPWKDDIRQILNGSLDLGVAFWLHIKAEFVLRGGRVLHPRSEAALRAFSGALATEAAALARPYLI